MANHRLKQKLLLAVVAAAGAAVLGVFARLTGFDKPAVYAIAGAGFGLLVSFGTSWAFRGAPDSRGELSVEIPASAWPKPKEIRSRSGVLPGPSFYISPEVRAGQPQPQHGSKRENIIVLTNAVLVHEHTHAAYANSSPPRRLLFIEEENEQSEMSSGTSRRGSTGIAENIVPMPRRPDFLFSST
jgi:hypothetical protein